MTDKFWRANILSEALRMTDDVKYPVRKVVIPVQGVPVDTQAGYMSYAYDLRLDGLSLKSRAIKELMLVDKARARQAVFEIGGDLKLKPLKCSDTMAYDVSDIYSTVGTVAKGVFTAKEIEEGIRGQFVVPWLETIKSPAQIGPAIALLTELRGSEAEKFLLFSALSRAIDRNFDDYRSFEFVAQRDRLTSKVAILLSGIGDESQKTELTRAYRGFLVKNLKAERCKDSISNKNNGLPSIVSEANYLFPDKPITADDIANETTGERALVVRYWSSRNSTRMQSQFRKFRDDMKSDQLSDDEKAVKFDQFMESLSSWTSSADETEAEVFNQKAVLLRTAFSFVADVKMRERLTKAFIQFLDSSSLQKESFIEWLVHARWLEANDPKMFASLLTNSRSSNLHLLVKIRDL